MKRPLLTIGVAFAVGAWAPFLLPGLPPALCSGGLAALGLGAALLQRCWKGLPAPVRGVWLPVALLSLALGVASFSLYRQRQILPLEQAAGEQVRLEGVVTGTQVRPPAYLLTVRASFPGTHLPDTTLRLRSYTEDAFAPGEGIAATVTLETLKGAQGYYRARGIFASSRLEEAAPLPLEQLSFFPRLDAFFLRLNARMTANLYRNLPGETAELLSAMVLGADLPQEVSSSLSKAGTVHITSVSGLHLSVVVGAAAALLERLRLHRRLVALGGGLAALAFALLVGFSPAIARALVMMLVVQAGRAFSRRSDTLNSLGLALLLVGIFAPHWLLSGGLWLSASSTAGIAALAGPLQTRMLRRYRDAGRPTRLLARLFWGAAAVSLGAYAFSFPVLLCMFGWVSLVSPLANLLIAPLVAPALLCGMACAALAAAPLPLAWAARVLTGWIVAISRLLAGLPFATFAVNEGWKLLWLLGLGVSVVLLARWGWRRQLAAYTAALLAFAFTVGMTTLQLDSRDQIEVVALEGCSPTLLIRQGSAVVVGAPTPYEIGSLLRYLDYRGISKLDALVAYDCGEQISSGLTRLVAETSPDLVIGPNDAYILGQMSRALPGTRVLSGGYGEISALGGATVVPHLTGGGADLQIGPYSVAKTGREYGIISLTGAVGIWAEGVLLWSPQAKPAPELLGALLFGEQRIILNV